MELFEPWLYQIARNVCVDYLRNEVRRRKLFVPLTEQHDRVTPQADPTDPVAAERLSAAMAKLGDGQREVLALSMEEARGAHMPGRSPD